MTPATLPIFQRFPQAVFIDLEVDVQGEIFRAGVLGADIAEDARRHGVESLLQRVNDSLTEQSLICGHNILDHDLPVLADRYPSLKRIQEVPVLDSLFLSPLAYPKKPYHALVKNKTLVSMGNRPLSDCEASAQVLADILEVWSRFAVEQNGSLSLLTTCLLRGDLPRAGIAGVARIMEYLGLADLNLAEDEAWSQLSGLCAERVCERHLRELWQESLADTALRTAFAYVLAWLPVAGSDSILPPWVSRRFPLVESMVARLRRHSCGEPDCRYCVNTHDATAQLRQWFGFPSYRVEPSLPGQPGRSLQETLVREGMNGKSLLGILPTGGGKSLCFQVPALYRYYTTGALTIVISPLQSLMKDQVENLVQRAGIYSSAALYGLLSMAERRVLLDELMLGSKGLLYVSPEQLRSPSFRRAILNRRIECWVYDEAHCLSKWGHDFRPDYLYVARFIRELIEEQGTPMPSVCCVTATAKLDVQQEICEHIKEQLGLDLTIYDGGAGRSNLSYQVETAKDAGKDERIHEILQSRIGFPDGEGTAVVFCTTRKSTERVADALKRRGWAVECFHAGLESEEKKRVFEAFMSGQVRVIAATNAFGMGVDKPDIRVVIHAEAPGSLESYLQEAGRAGRDGMQAECIMLFDRKDLEKQFRLSGHSRLHLDDVQDMWRAIYKADRKKIGEVVLTDYEILRHSGNDNDTDPFASTKVRTAVALLEKQGFLERNENRPIVFQGRLLVKDEAAGLAKIEVLGLDPLTERLWKAYLRIFVTLSDTDACGLEPFIEHELTDTALERYRKGRRRSISPYRFVINVLNDMAAPAAGLIRKGILFSAWLKAGQRANAGNDLKKLVAAETAFLGMLRELAPDAEGWLRCHVAAINQQLSSREGHGCTPEVLAHFLHQWETDPRQLFGRSPNMEVSHSGKDFFFLRLLGNWQDVANAMRTRHNYLQVLIDFLLAKVSGTESEVLVDFSEYEVLESFQNDLGLRGEPLHNPGEGLLGLLNFAHKTRLLNLQSGKALISTAMTLRLNPEKTNGKRITGFTKGDFSPLAAFYEERILQIHVMAEYARVATEKIAAHVTMIADYFRLGKEAFARRYLREDQSLYRRATGIESYRAIVSNLGNPEQEAIVSASEHQNRIILAGPGSGKTRVITHRCAYLLRVRRLRPQNVLVLCFNRNACLELRRRIYALVEEDAHGVIVSTYHGLALRLLGRSLAEISKRQRGKGIDFKELLREATAWLQGEREVVGADPDNLRAHLLGDIRHILIDEYQDVDEDEYRFIRALSGVDIKGDDQRRPVLMAVGDDDQSIYGFKGANVTYIRKFCDEYEAQEMHLVENYRSTAYIIAAANHLIANNRDRMKATYRIRIDNRRKQKPPGGVWAERDPVVRGRVHRVQVANAVQQALAVVHRIGRLREMDPEMDWNQVAILSRRNDVLMPLRALLEERGLPFHHDAVTEDLPSLLQVRQVARWLRYLEERSDEEWSARMLRQHFIDIMGDSTDPWTQLLDEIARELQGTYGDLVIRVPEIRTFFYDALSERKRQRAISAGIRLLTIHRAKGLEFNHVFLLDGGWEEEERQSKAGDVEEDRRVYYVGMTRACQTLVLLERADLRSRFPREVETEGVFVQKAPQLEPQPGDCWMWRRYAMLTPEDLFLSFAGTRPPQDRIHQRLAALREGDLLTLEARGNRHVLLNASGEIVAQLSTAGSAKWGPRAAEITAIRVVAMIERDAEEGTTEFSIETKTPRWELPICEMVTDTRTAESMSVQPIGPSRASKEGVS